MAVRKCGTDDEDCVSVVSVLTMGTTQHQIKTDTKPTMMTDCCEKICIKVMPLLVNSDRPVCNSDSEHVAKTLVEPNLIQMSGKQMSQL